jgi:hypothetical protein
MLSMANAWTEVFSLDDGGQGGDDVLGALAADSWQSCGMLHRKEQVKYVSSQQYGAPLPQIELLRCSVLLWCFLMFIYITSTPLAGPLVSSHQIRCRRFTSSGADEAV